MVSNRLKYYLLVFSLLPIIYLGASSFVMPKGEIKEHFGKIKPRWEYTSNQYDPKSPPTLILSVQGGSTNTTGALFQYDPTTSRFTELFREKNMGSSLNHAPEQALAIVRNFINSTAKMYPNEPITIVMGMAGTEFAGGRGLFLNGLVENTNITHAILTSDAETAWLSVFDNEGLIMVVGTGGVTLATTKDGHKYQSGGHGGPISDYPSATSLVFDYDRCSESISSLSDGHWHYSEPLPLMEKWIKNHGGDPDNFFAYRSQLLTSGKNDTYASRAKDIIDYYRQQQPTPKATDVNTPTSLQTEDSGNTPPQHPLKEGDYCVSYAINKAFGHFKEELVAKHISPAFSSIPFAFDGTVGGELWKLMEREQQANGLKSRKSPLKPDLIVGALRLVYDHIPAEKFRAMITSNQFAVSSSPGN
ncbi:hypothetical protein [Endozoicomonas sp. Mp262]|uniref:hypothetical protein n=1 Tax=Endozoicomonas sp. Mp262 TaxID=2919499 RepID=UPI0021DAAD85